MWILDARTRIRVARETNAENTAHLPGILGTPELLGQVPVLAVAGAVDGHLLAPDVSWAGNFATRYFPFLQETGSKMGWLPGEKRTRRRPQTARWVY